MRELTVRLKFTTHCLGNVKDPATGNFTLPRSGGRIVFLASWHRANLDFAARTLGRHQGESTKISWDIFVDGVLRSDCWYRRNHKSKGGKPAGFCWHEAFFPGQVVGVNCVVPPAISDEDFWSLMSIAGTYRGLSPWKPAENGFFEVVSLRPRRQSAEPEAKEAPETQQAEG